MHRLHICSPESSIENRFLDENQRSQRTGKWTREVRSLSELAMRGSPAFFGRTASTFGMDTTSPPIPQADRTSPMPKSASTLGKVLIRTSLKEGTCLMRGATRFRQCVLPSLFAAVRRHDLNRIQRRGQPFLSRARRCALSGSRGVQSLAGIRSVNRDRFVSTMKHAQTQTRIPDCSLSSTTT